MKVSFPHLRRTGLASVLAVLAAFAGPLYAWPDKPLKLLVPYAAGGSADQVARVLAEHLRVDLGQPVIVENRPGGNTAIAATQVAGADPDGQTLLLASGASLVFNPLLYKKLSYDPQRDLEPVAIVASLPLVVLVSPNKVSSRSIAELVALAKAQPGKLNYASVGIGNPLHLATELFLSSAGIEMLHVPYNGSAPALSAMLAGDVQVFFDASSTALPQVKAGKLRALAVTSTQRFPLLPEVPTLAELGFTGYEAGIWYGVAVPSRTPPERVALLHRSLSKALADPALRSGLEAAGMIVYEPRSLQDVKAYVRADTDRWRSVTQGKHISLD